MKLTPMLAIALVTAALAVPAASADPAGVVKSDLDQIQADVTRAHDTLLTDLGKITADLGKGDRAALRADVQTFRTDRRSFAGTFRSDIAQLRADLQAAKDAKVDPADLKSLVQSTRALARTDRADVHSAARQAREALSSLRSSTAPKS